MGNRASLCGRYPDTYVSDVVLQHNAASGIQVEDGRMSGAYHGEGMGLGCFL